MAKKESTFVNMVLTLFIVTAVSSLTLALVYSATEGPIAEAKQARLNELIGIVVPGAAEGEVHGPIEVQPIDGREDAEPLLFYEIKKDGELLGTAIRTYTNRGFSGYISVMVGFDADGVILDSNVLEHRETPGLGDKICKSVDLWNEQYIGKDPSSTDIRVRKDGGELDGLTAATITARAYSDAIQRAYDTYMKYIEDKGNDEDVLAEELIDDENDNEN